MSNEATYRNSPICLGSDERVLNVRWPCDKIIDRNVKEGAYAGKKRYIEGMHVKGATVLTAAPREAHRGQIVQVECIWRTEGVL